jgi:hypothetical protein
MEEGGGEGFINSVPPQRHCSSLAGAAADDDDPGNTANQAMLTDGHDPTRATEERRYLSHAYTVQ